MFEHYIGPPKLRNWAEIEARVIAHHQQERVKAEAFLRAHRAVRGLAVAVLALLITLAYTLTLLYQPAPPAPVCPANVMQLDPTTVYGHPAPAIEI